MMGLGAIGCAVLTGVYLYPSIKKAQYETRNKPRLEQQDAEIRALKDSIFEAKRHGESLMKRLAELQEDCDSYKTASRTERALLIKQNNILIESKKPE